MKLLVTYPEAVEIIAERHCISTEKVEIVMMPKQQISMPLVALINEAKKFRYKDEKFRYKDDQKIAAIKAVREEAERLGWYLGLYEAKIFVESLA